MHRNIANSSDTIVSHAKPAATATDTPEKNAASSNFLVQVVEQGLAEGKYASRHWSGKPGPAAQQQAGPLDPAAIRTRFPPEPNGYLHFGHAKSICLNFGLAERFGGACHMRFDDTNPTKEEQEYVDSIIESVKWLGYGWQFQNETNLYFASDYFGFLYAFAEKLIEAGHAYVDEQSADEIRQNRGTLTQPGTNSPWRDRPAVESMDLFRRMKAGEFADGSLVLRLKIDMASGNINLRDPLAYRIRHAHHHRTGDAWCIYPLYDFTHGVSDSLENITHSICTLEFESHRPLYDWLNERLAELGCLNTPLPQQYEFSRLNLTYVVLSKRKLIQLVDEGHVQAWDDPRMPTLVGARRRGYTPAGFRLFAERIGVSRSDSLIDYTVLEDCMREDLNIAAERRIAVLDPIKLVITNYPEGQSETCHAPNHPLKPELGKREVQFSRELWIEREDFAEAPPKGFHRLYPGNKVRLRYGYVIECTGCEKDAAGKVTTVYATYFEDSKSGTPGADTYKVKGNSHWISVGHACAAEVRLYDRLFKRANPGGKLPDTPEGETRDFIDDLNPDSITTIQAQVEASLADVTAETVFQFERHGYFVADRFDTKPGNPVFNRTVTLRDSWGKAGQ